MNDLTIPEVKVFQAELGGILPSKIAPSLLKLIREKRKLEPDVEKGHHRFRQAPCPGNHRKTDGKRRPGSKFDEYVDGTEKAEPAGAKK